MNLGEVISLKILSRGIIVIYFTGLTFFTIPFAKFKIFSMFYSTDIILFLLSFLILDFLIKSVKSKEFHITPIGIIGTLILIWATIEFFRGLHLYHSYLYALRQLAPFLYIMLIPIMFYLYDDKKQIDFLLKMVFGVSVLTAGLYFIESWAVGHYISWGVGSCIAIYLYHNSGSIKQKRLISLGAWLLLTAMFTIPTRGVWISIIIVIGLLLFASHVFKCKLWGDSLNGVVVVLLVISLAGVTGFIRNSTQNTSRWISIFNIMERDRPNDEEVSKSSTQNNQTAYSIANNNIRWRMYVWLDMLRDWSKKPLLGYGLGKKFFSKKINSLGWAGHEGDLAIFKDKDIGLDPHNSHIHVLYMMGAIGLIIFESFFLLIFFKYLRLLALKMISVEKKSFYCAILSAILYILILANFEVVIESPYMVMYLWLCVGILISMKMHDPPAINF